MPLDEFNPDVILGEWLFTVALGAGLGLVLAGGVLALVRPKFWQLTAGGLCAVGLALSALTGTLALDAAPWQAIDIRLKPYLGTVAETAAMAGALLLGMVVTASVVLAAVWAGRRRGFPLWASTVAGGAVAVLCLAAFLPFVGANANAPRHPSGTDTSQTVTAIPVLDGLDIPTGIDIASNGDMLIVELPGRRALVASPAAAGAYSVSLEVPLGLSEDVMAFHGAFHPAYPETPIAYVVAQAGTPGSRTLEVLQVALDGSGTTRSVISGLPTSQRNSSHHHGAGLAICGDYLFVSTSDGDSTLGPALPGTPRWAERARAQLPNSGYGQVMRWQIRGTELVPAGVFGGPFPSWAMGLRNPYGMGCDAVTEVPLVADNGERGFDQVRLAEPGSNHGWPVTRERIEVQPPWFDSGAARIAPTGIAPRGDADTFVISAFGSEALYELTVDRDAGETTAFRLLADVEGGAYAVAVDSQGCVYFTDVGSVYRLQEPGCE